MKYAHAVKLRGIVSPEREEDLKQSLVDLLRDERDDRSYDDIVDEEDVSFDVDETEDFTGNELRFVRTEYRKTRHTNQVLSALRDALSEGDRVMIAEQMDRLDEDLNFHIRLDLDAFLDDMFILTEDGDCVHIRVKVAAYPAKQEKARSVITTMLGVEDNV